MLHVNSDGSIELTRGDTARLKVNIKNDTSDSAYNLATNDILKLTIKKTVKDSTPVVQKVVSGSNVFHITPDDTKDLEFGKYKYDVQLTTVDGDVYTVIEPSTFTILTEVTW